MPDAKMTPTRPYLIRAFYEWIMDNDCTPYLVIDATHEHVHVPPQHVEDGRIVLNISDLAVSALHISNEAVEFKARFSGRLNAIYAPTQAVIAIYAKGNGRGMVFPEDEESDSGGAPPPEGPGGNAPPPQSPTGGKKTKGKPHLRVVK